MTISDGQRIRPSIKLRLLKALGLLFVLGLVLVGCVVWFLKATMDEQNTVVDAHGHRIVIDLPGSVSQPIGWMNEGWQNVDADVETSVYDSATPVFPACTNEELKGRIGDADCSIILSDRCSPSVRFIKFVEREGESQTSGATLKNVLFKIRDRSGSAFLKSVCSGKDLKDWTAPLVKETPNANPPSSNATLEEATEPQIAPAKSTILGTANLSPTEMLRRCPKLKGAPDTTVEWGNDEKSTFSAVDCGGNAIYVISAQSENSEACAINLNSANGALLIMMARPSELVISSAYASESGSEIKPWTIQVTRSKGTLNAMSRDGSDPPIACE